MGRWAEAVQLAQQVRTEYAPLVSGDHVDTATGSRALATAWWPTRRADLIAPLLAEEEAVLARLKADTAAKTMARHRSRTYLAAWGGDLETVQAQSAAVLADTTPAFAYERARVTCARSIVLLRLGRHSEALPLAEQALGMAQTQAPNLTPVHVSHAHEALGLVLLELGQVNKALSHLQMAETELERGQVVPSVWYADIRLGQARVHILRGDHVAAQGLLSQVEAWWAGANPGSVWHAQAKAWQTKAAELPA
jgi:tetratricopeptide (TPR) repeat protein